MSFEIRNFNVQPTQVARGGSITGDTQARPRREEATSPLGQDEIMFATGSRVNRPVDYPTVGEYVKTQFNEKMGTALDGLHLVAETLPPVIVAEIVAIQAKHKKAALQQIWSLPMDPQGKWKIAAQQILDAESAKATAEIKQLPMIRALRSTGEAIANGATWVGHQVTALFDGAGGRIRAAMQRAGQLISHGANYVLDGVVNTGVAIGQGVQSVGRGIEEGSRKAGEAVRHGARIAAFELEQAYDHTIEGAQWLGRQAVEVPKTAARGVVRGIGGLGQDMVDFSNRTAPIFAPAN